MVKHSNTKNHKNHITSMIQLVPILMLYLLITGCSGSSQSISSGIDVNKNSTNVVTEAVTPNSSIKIPQEDYVVIVINSTQNISRPRPIPVVASEISLSACTNATKKSLCGTDGKTYDSECALSAQQPPIGIAYVGVCSSSSQNIPGTSCQAKTELVCGFIGAVTYQNKCLAEFYNATVKHDSACTDADRTTCVDNKVVCGTNGKSYGSECTAKRFNVTVAYEGKCK